MWLTDKGKDALKKLGFDVPARGRGGPEHEYWKERVAQHLQSLGLEVTVEKAVNGFVDIIARKNAETLAFEIETGASDILSNILKAAEKGYKLIIVATNPEGLRKAHAVARNLPEGLAGSIKIVAAKDFLKLGSIEAL